MGLLSALFAALSRKMGDFISALVGWSVGALFGQISPRHRTMVSVALLLSVCWPVFIIGAFFPSVATTLLAFVPIENPTIKLVMRTVWIVLAVAAPVIVGLLIRAVSKSAREKSVWSSMLNGYPLALGFAVSFVITVFTVPAVKISTILRRWTNEHLYVQPKQGQYDLAVRDLCEACVWAGLTPTVHPVPSSMALSTKAIRFFSRGAVTDLIIGHPKMVRAQGLEAFLYPADLLLRGEKNTLSQLRGMLPRTELEHHALLVRSDRGQKLQLQLGELEAAIVRHRSPEEIGDGLQSRLKAIAEEMRKPGLPWEDWVILDGIARRLENQLLGNDSILDRTGSARASAIARREQARQHPDPKIEQALADVQHAPLTRLVDAAIHEARELVKLEVAMARVEAKRELKAALVAVSALGVAMGFIATSFFLLIIAGVLALGGRPVHALIAAGVMMGVAAILGAIGYGKLPLEPLRRTREHLELDLHHIREHLA